MLAIHPCFIDNKVRKTAQSVVINIELILGTEVGQRIDHAVNILLIRPRMFWRHYSHSAGMAQSLPKASTLFEPR